MSVYIGCVPGDTINTNNILYVLTEALLLAKTIPRRGPEDKSYSDALTVVLCLSITVSLSLSIICIYIYIERERERKREKERDRE